MCTCEPTHSLTATKQICFPLSRFFLPFLSFVSILSPPFILVLPPFSLAHSYLLSDLSSSSLLWSYIYLHPTPTFTLLFCLSVCLPDHPQNFSISTRSFSVRPSCLSMEAVLVPVRNSFVFFTPKQHMHARYQGHLFPRWLKALVFPCLSDERVTGQSCIGQAAQRGGMWVTVANDTLALSLERQLTDNLCWTEVKRVIVIRLSLSIYLSFSSQTLSFLAPSLLSTPSPVYFSPTAQFLNTPSLPQPAFSL